MAAGPNPMNLEVGDLVIALQDDYFTHAGAKGKLAQVKGKMLMVNNPYPNGHVSGTGLTHGSLGYGCSLRPGTYRRAKPSDPGYLMTVQEWDRYQPERFVRALWNISFAWQLWWACVFNIILIEKFA